MSEKTAVILFQMGGPDSPEAVEPFLFNLFNDPDIIDFPLAFLARKHLARFISRRRAPRVTANYGMIGGKSPILELTKHQERSLEALLRKDGVNATVLTAMRYWHPLTDSVVRSVREGSFDRAVLLPLYPQMSGSTTLSSLNEWNRECRRQGLKIPTELICCYPMQPDYIAAIVGTISASLLRFDSFPPETSRIVFSAHGVPVSYIRKGDPYQLHVEATVDAVVAAGKWPAPHVLCYQSRVGPMKWLAPSLLQTVDDLGKNGIRNVLVVPIAFVTDHIETLHEIGIEVRREAMHSGITHFEVTPGLNDHPKFIAGLARLVESRLAGEGRSRTCALLFSAKPHRPRPRRCPHFPER